MFNFTCLLRNTWEISQLLIMETLFPVPSRSSLIISKNIVLCNICVNEPFNSSKQSRSKVDHSPNRSDNEPNSTLTEAFNKAFRTSFLGSLNWSNHNTPNAVHYSLRNPYII